MQEFWQQLFILEGLGEGGLPFQHNSPYLPLIHMPPDYHPDVHPLGMWQRVKPCWVPRTSLCAC